MKPAHFAELELIEAKLRKMNLGHTADRLHLVLYEDASDDERPFPVQDAAREVAAIPWGLAELLYPAYGHDQDLETIARRAGFGRRELGLLAVDAYGGGVDTGRRRGILGGRWPILTLYELATRRG